MANTTRSPTACYHRHTADKKDLFDLKVDEALIYNTPHSNEERYPSPPTSVSRSKRLRGLADEDDGYVQRVLCSKHVKHPSPTPGDTAIRAEVEQLRRHRIPDTTLNKLLIVDDEVECPWPQCKKVLRILQTDDGDDSHTAPAKNTALVTKHFKEHIVRAGGTFESKELTQCPACPMRLSCGSFVRHVLGKHWGAKWACYTHLPNIRCSWRGTRSDTVLAHMKRKHQEYLHLVPQAAPASRASSPSRRRGKGRGRRT